MSLDFQYNKVKDYETVTKELDSEGRKVWTPWAQTIPWVCMAVDVGSITEANKDEFLKRAKMWEKCVGAFLRINGDAGIVDHPITKEIVDQYVGTWTNVTTRDYRYFVQKLASVVLEEKLGYRLANKWFTNPVCGAEHPTERHVYCRKDAGHVEDGDYRHDDFKRSVGVTWEEEHEDDDDF